MAEAKNPTGNVPQAGTVVAPSASASTQPVQAAAAPALPAAPTSPRPPQPPATTPQPPAPLEDPSPSDPETGPEPNDEDHETITWTASEFVARDKSPNWYLLLAVGTVAAAALVFLIAGGIISVVVVISAGLLLGIYGTHQPKQRQYRLDQNGIGIGDKYYGYDDFRSFTIAPEEAFAGIVLMPLKRFAVPITIYYAPDDEEKILTILSDHMPFEEYRGDAVEDLMRHIRF